MMEVDALCALPHSRLLGEIHISLLRLLQADMEEAHAAGGQGAGALNAADKAISQSAACLEEAWAWGFDVDVWRAHLNALTWPEVRDLVPMICPDAAWLSEHIAGQSSPLD
jgi:hypothetical protein